jgi:hypothetical protein
MVHNDPPTATCKVESVLLNRSSYPSMPIEMMEPKSTAA